VDSSRVVNSFRRFLASAVWPRRVIHAGEERRSSSEVEVEGSEGTRPVISSSNCSVVGLDGMVVGGWWMVDGVCWLIWIRLDWG